MKGDVFDLGKARIRGNDPRDPVEVWRIPPEGQQRAVYHKYFKQEGKYGDLTYWAERENDFLALFRVKRLKHVAQPKQMNWDRYEAIGSQDPPGIGTVITYDAGITIEDWLRVQPRYADGTTLSHPFQRVQTFLLLIRACLAALKELHYCKILHCDIKEDNICLPYAPYPYCEGQTVRLLFNELKLIDFAFSLDPENRLRRPLQLDPIAPYQSDQLKAALQAHSIEALEQLDYGVDLFSLGYMAERFAEWRLDLPLGSTGTRILEDVRRLLGKLNAFGSAPQTRDSGALPHDSLIAEIDRWLEQFGGDGQQVAEFQVAKASLREEAKPGPAGMRATPLTPIATPVTDAAPVTPIASPVMDAATGLPPDASPSVRKPPWRKVVAGLGAAAMLVGGGIVFLRQSEISEPILAPDPTTGKQEASPSGQLSPTIPAGKPERSVVKPSPSQPAPDPFEEARDRLASQLRGENDQAFQAAFQELMRFASGGKAGAAELAEAIANEYGTALNSRGPAASRQRGLSRLNLMATGCEKTAAQRLAEFEKVYDETKQTVANSAWWLHGEGTRPKETARWMESGAVLAASGDRPAMLDQAFAAGQGRLLEQDRAKSVELYLQVIERSKNGDAFSMKIREAAVRGLVTMLNAVIEMQDRAAAARLQPLMESRANAGAADMQYYLGLMEECVLQPTNLNAARQWYRKASADLAWRDTAERKLEAIGKWCPGH